MISEELTARFPDATLTRRIQLPVMAAALAIRGGEASRGLALLEPVRPYDRARSAEFWPVYLRGLAYLATKNGTEAARQFQAILDRRGEAPDAPVFPLSHLGLARAAALSGEVERAAKAYEAFFDVWRDADADLRPLREAHREYARLR